jgi:hypothetical protein
MNAVVALGMGRSIAACTLRLATAFLVCTCAYGQAANSQVNMSATSLPRFDSGGAMRSSRVDMTLLPTPQSSLGPSLAMTSPDARSFPGGRPFSGSLLTTIDLGLHWRYTSEGNYRFDVSAWRRMNPQDTARLTDSGDSYGARVEMHLTPSRRSGFVADHGFLGFQLESGARITLRKGGGGKPMLYYRSKF